MCTASGKRAERPSRAALHHRDPRVIAAYLGAAEEEAIAVMESGT